MTRHAAIRLAQQARYVFALGIGSKRRFRLAFLIRQGATLAEIGHLDKIIQQSAYLDGNEGVYRHLANQIADAARSDSHPYSFIFTFNFTEIAFSLGKSSFWGV